MHYNHWTSLASTPSKMFLKRKSTMVINNYCEPNKGTPTEWMDKALL
jgi:hypothetical protein